LEVQRRADSIVEAVVDTLKAVVVAQKTGVVELPSQWAQEVVVAVAMEIRKNAEERVALAGDGPQNELETRCLDGVVGWRCRLEPDGSLKGVVAENSSQLGPDAAAGHRRLGAEGARGENPSREVDLEVDGSIPASRDCTFEVEPESGLLVGTPQACIEVEEAAPGPRLGIDTPGRIVDAASMDRRERQARLTSMGRATLL